MLDWLRKRLKANLLLNRGPEEVGLIEESLSDGSAFCIRIFNDDVTPVDFVVDVLMDVLELGRKQAVHLALRAHESGAADVGRMGSERAHLFVEAISARSRK